MALPPVILASIKFQRDSNDAYLDVRDRIGNTLSHLQEGIAGVRVIQAFAREDVEVDRFAEGNREPLREPHALGAHLGLVPAGHRARRAGARPPWRSASAGWWVHEDMLTVGTVAFFVLTLSNLFEPVQQLSQLFNMVQSAGAGLHKLYELLDTPVDVAERPGAVDLPDAGDIEVDDVSFAYGDGPRVLRDVTLHDPRRVSAWRWSGPPARASRRWPSWSPGSTTRPRARSASAASTCATPRWRRCASASWSSPRRGSCSTARSATTCASRRAGATTPRSTTPCGPSAPTSGSRRLPEGLDTEVRERGSRLSAGEKQLVSLARAALADPAVLVLDEATSSLDPGTEALVEAAVDRLMEGRTVVVIAHRLSTSERADLVGVVDGGELVELGTHDELVAGVAPTPACTPPGWRARERRPRHAEFTRRPARRHLHAG